MARWILCISIITLTGCALSKNATMGTTGAAAEIAAMMVGDFEADLVSNGNDFLDRRRALAALGDGSWVYLQLNSGPQRTLYRQRVLQLIARDDGSVIQNTYSLALPADKRDLINDPERLAAITLDDLTATLNKDCDIIWRRVSDDTDFAWHGIVSPQRCVIFSERRQTQLRIGAESKIGANTLWHAERGFDMDNKLLWGIPVGSFTHLNRIDP